MSEIVRKERIKRLIKMLKSAEPPVEERKFVSIASFNIGVTIKKIREYLDLLEGMDAVKYDDGVLIWQE